MLSPLWKLAEGPQVRHLSRTYMEPSQQPPAYENIPFFADLAVSTKWRLNKGIFFLNVPLYLCHTHLFCLDPREAEQYLVWSTL